MTAGTARTLAPRASGDQGTVGQADILRTIVEAADCFEDGVDIERLASVHDIEAKHVRTRVSRLVARKYVRSSKIGYYVPTAEGRAFAATGQPIQSGPLPGYQQRPEPSRRDCLKARLWRAIKRSKHFTRSQLLLAAARPDDGKPEPSAQRYLNSLARAGYLHELPRRAKTDVPHSAGEKIYILIEDSGAQHPRERKNRAGVWGVYDPNLAEWRPFLDDETGSEREPVR